MAMLFRWICCSWGAALKAALTPGHRTALVAALGHQPRTCLISAHDNTLAGSAPGQEEETTGK